MKFGIIVAAHKLIVQRAVSSIQYLSQTENKFSIYFFFKLKSRKD